MQITQEQIDIIERVANYLAPRMTFGYHTVEDIKQECSILGMEALGKYDDTKGASLHTFIHLYVKRRMLNLKRDTYLRPIPKNASKSKKEIMSKNNELKKSLVRAAGSPANDRLSYQVEMEGEDEGEALVSLIKENLPIELLSDFNAFIDGAKLPKHRRKILLEHIKQIYEQSKTQ